MTRCEFKNLIRTLKKRRDKAYETRQRLFEIRADYERIYLQGSIDTLNNIIESLEKRFEYLDNKHKN